MARPREPINLIVAKGKKHLTKAEYEARKSSEIIASSDNIVPPAYLAKKEKEKFNDIAKQLMEIGIISNLDCDILARYIKAEGEYLKLTKQLDKIKFAQGKNPLSAKEKFEEDVTKYAFFQKLQVKAFRQCNECARELGLTISSRCKLVMPKKEEEKHVNKFLKHAR